MSREGADSNVRTNARWKRIAVYAAVLLGAFLLGLVPMWLAASGGARERNAAQRDRLRPLPDQRDELITLLARSDPASAERLSALYVSNRKAPGDAQAPGGK